MYILKLFCSYADAVITGNDMLVKKNGGIFPEKVVGISTYTMQGVFFV